MSKREIVFRGRRFHVARQGISLDHGGTATREVVLHPGSVTIVPLVAHGSVCLIRSRRWSVGETLLELPAGTLDPGEDPDAAARRELQEETGYFGGTLTKLLEFYTSPGFLNERMHLYLADRLTPGPQRLEPDERIETLVVTWEAAMRMIADGQIVDGKTLVGLLYCQTMLSDTVSRPASD